MGKLDPMLQLAKAGKMWICKQKCPSSLRVRPPPPTACTSSSKPSLLSHLMTKTGPSAHGRIFET